MAETPSKRLRGEEAPDAGESSTKRPYSNILSLLDEEEESHGLNQDLSAIFTTLEQELSSTAADFDFSSLPPAAGNQTAEEEDDGAKSVMRHLLEASDDELGIPNCSEEIISNAGVDSGEGISVNLFDNGLWEFDDVAANYYTILQSELFL